MRLLSALFALVFFVGIAAAQDASPVPSGYAIALQRIETARVDSTVVSLDLMNLRLTELPPEIGDLVHIKHLYLQDNQLSSLPPEIGNLRNLETLFLASNHFSSLPIEIGNLSNLRRLELSQNELRFPLKLPISTT